jgi:hypothetical protein
MKTIACHGVLLLALLTPAFSRAELLIYKELEKQTFTGEGEAVRTISKGYVIIDHFTGQFARVAYGTFFGAKHYWTWQETNSHIVQVTGAKGKIYSVISHIPTDCEAKQSDGNEALILKGANSTLTYNTGQTTSFPKTLNDYGLGLVHSSRTGTPAINEGTVVLVFSQSDTVASNAAGETVDTAFARLTAFVQSLGYTP